MQTTYLHKKVYQIKRIDESEYSEKVYERYDKIRLFQKLRKEGCSEATALEAINMSRAKYYRLLKRYKARGLAGLEDESKRPNKLRKPRWDSHTEKMVLDMRRKYPLWGKYKLAVMIKHVQKANIPVSTIGRILKIAIAKGVIKPVAFYYGKMHFKPRVFNNHAKRLLSGMRSSGPGKQVQVDHMDVQLNGLSVKHFKAICPYTKIVVEQAYKSASSAVAAQFLKMMLEEFPFPISSIQVDGGSEFMGEFEKGCKALNIPLYVLPPRSPELNGCVERGNGTVKYEFYMQYDGPGRLDSVQTRLQNYVIFYNTTRPHQTLNYLTPKEYYSELIKRAP